LTVDGCQAANQDVICPVECYRLHCKESKLMLRDKPLMNYGIFFLTKMFMHIVDLVKVC
jgi:hypothetical protein